MNLFQVLVILRPTVSRPVRLVVGAHDQILIFFCLTITSFLLHVGRPLWRAKRSVIYSVITHWLESRGTRNHILLSHLRLPQPVRPGPRIYIPPGTEWPSFTPGHWVPFSSQVYGGDSLTRLHTGHNLLVKVKVKVMLRLTVSQYVVMSSSL
jgi:hypothetical protein